MTLDEIMQATIETAPAPEAPAPKAREKAPEAPQAAPAGLLDYLLASPDTLAPEAPQAAPAADPYGLGVYSGQAPAPRQAPAPEAAPVDVAMGALAAPTPAQVADRLRAAFVAPRPTITDEQRKLLGQEGFSYLLPDGRPGVLVAGLASAGDRVLVKHGAAHSYVNLGRQVSPGIWTIAGEENEPVPPGGKLCPGDDSCRTKGWPPGTPSCRGWRGRRN